MSFECSFLVIRISVGFLMIIDTNTRVKYLSGNNLLNYDQFIDKQVLHGMSPLYKEDGSLDTVTKEELDYLISKAMIVKYSADWHNHTHEKNHIGLRVFKI